MCVCAFLHSCHLTSVLLSFILQGLQYLKHLQEQHERRIKESTQIIGLLESHTRTLKSSNASVQEAINNAAQVTRTPLYPLEVKSNNISNIAAQNIDSHLSAPHSKPMILATHFLQKNDACARDVSLPPSTSFLAQRLKVFSHGAVKLLKTSESNEAENDPESAILNTANALQQNQSGLKQTTSSTVNTSTSATAFNTHSLSSSILTPISRHAATSRADDNINTMHGSKYAFTRDRAFSDGYTTTTNSIGIQTTPQLTLSAPIVHPQLNASNKEPIYMRMKRGGGIGCVSPSSNSFEGVASKICNGCADEAMHESKSNIVAVLSAEAVEQGKATEGVGTGTWRTRKMHHSANTSSHEGDCNQYNPSAIENEICQSTQDQDDCIKGSKGTLSPASAFLMKKCSTLNHVTSPYEPSDGLPPSVRKTSSVRIVTSSSANYPFSSLATVSANPLITISEASPHNKAGSLERIRSASANDATAAVAAPLTHFIAPSCTRQAQNGSTLSLPSIANACPSRAQSLPSRAGMHRSSTLLKVWREAVRGPASGILAEKQHQWRVSYCESASSVCEGGKQNGHTGMKTPLRKENEPYSIYSMLQSQTSLGACADHDAMSSGKSSLGETL